MVEDTLRWPRKSPSNAQSGKLVGQVSVDGSNDVADHIIADRSHPSSPALLPCARGEGCQDGKGGFAFGIYWFSSVVEFSVQRGDYEHDGCSRLRRRRMMVRPSGRP